MDPDLQQRGRVESAVLPAAMQNSLPSDQYQQNMLRTQYKKTDTPSAQSIIFQ
jgi:hypothetical protein